MLRHRLMLVSAVVLLLLPVGAQANTDYYFSGHLCQFDDEPSEGSYSSNGAKNDTATYNQKRTVWCPIVGVEGPSSVNVDDANVYYFDGTDGFSVSCTLYVRNTSGTTYSTAEKFSCSTSQTTGCASESGGLENAYGTLNWNGSELPNSGSAIANVATYAFFCSIPSRFYRPAMGADQTDGYSFIRAYNVEQVSP